MTWDKCQAASGWVLTAHVWRDRERDKLEDAGTFNIGQIQLNNYKYNKHIFS